MVIAVDKNKSNRECVTGMGRGVSGEERVVSEDIAERNICIEGIVQAKGLATCLPGRSIFQGRTSAETAEEMPELERIE